MDSIKFDIPWHKVETANNLETQLYREVGKQHILFNQQVLAIARRQDMDDVLFFVPELAQYAIVHLTWANKQLTEKDSPSIELIREKELVQKRVDEDTKEWKRRENEPINETGGFIQGKKRIIIIGASSGIGKKMAEIYALDGNLVAVTGRRVELLQELTRSFRGRMIYSTFDVRESSNIENIQSLINRLGGLDILIISAGTGEPSKELNWAIDKTTVDTNVNGFVEIANWAFNYFIKQGHGQLANISSIAAVRGGSWAPAYNASKAFQSSYFEGLSLKAAKLNPSASPGHKISVTSVEPGFVATKMAKSDKLFWVVPVDKAARQIMKAIEKRRRKAYISRRWWLVAQALKWIPHWLYKKLA